MKLPKLPKNFALSLAAPAMLAMVVPATPMLAQEQTGAKIRLMSEALRARDAGDLDTAKKNLDELLAIAPNDTTVQRLLAGVDNAIAQRPAAPALTEAAPAVTSETAAPVAGEPSEVSYPPKAQPAPAPLVSVKAGSKSESAEADELVKGENLRIKGLVTDAKAKRVQARKFAKENRFDDAAAELDKAIASLPLNTLTASIISDLQAEKSALLMDKAQAALKQGDTDGARAALEAYSASTTNLKKIEKLANEIDAIELNPPLQPIDKVSPVFIKDQKEIAKLTAKGRSQYLAGDLSGAQDSFRIVESIDSGNPEVKLFLSRIANEKARVGELNRVKTRSQMIEEVNNSWQRPVVYLDRQSSDTKSEIRGALAQKLISIKFPSINFEDVALKTVINNISTLSEQYDKSDGVKGVNIVLNDSPNKNPRVNLTLRDVSLKTLLDRVVQNAFGYQYNVNDDTIVVSPGGETSMLDTQYFSVPKATLIRMTGSKSANAPSTAAADPFATPATVASAGDGSTGDERASLKRFFEQAGVKFDADNGSDLAYEGTGILVTQTARNLERIQTILNRFNDIKLVDIEAKFMEVQQGALDELGVNWQVGNEANSAFATGNRSITNAFTNTVSGNPGALSRVGEDAVSIPNSPATIPGGVDQGGDMSGIIGDAQNGFSLGSSGNSALGILTGVSMGEFGVEAQLRAISRQTGTDLMCAPKLTVLSGATGSITIATEMRYPQNYSEAKIQTGGGGIVNGVVSSSVGVSSGTPQDYANRNIGVELKVTPKVQDDDYTIDLDLSPKVTEFDGFVEFGGQNIAIAGDTVVTVPSGNYQPIFSTREVTTSVSVWDGATLVLGGLTREEVKKVNDKVPVLGDIPLLGALFRSKGETVAKRNLLIFVTPNLVNPGGSMKKQQLRNTKPATAFQSPTVVTPAGSESRSRN